MIQKTDCKRLSIFASMKIAIKYERRIAYPLTFFRPGKKHYCFQMIKKVTDKKKLVAAVVE